MLDWNVPTLAALSRFRTGMGNQLTHESVRILEGDNPLFVEACFRVLELDVMPDKSLDPEPHCAWQDRKRSDGNLSCTLTASSRARPRKKSENASGRTFAVTEIEMVSRGIVEIDGALYQVKAKNSRIEIEVALWIARNGSDVMNAG
jgi:hypothetical protein